jgi:hypothetical protein
MCKSIKKLRHRDITQLASVNVLNDGSKEVVASKCILKGTVLVSKTIMTYTKIMTDADFEYPCNFRYETLHHTFVKYMSSNNNNGRLLTTGNVLVTKTIYKNSPITIKCGIKTWLTIIQKDIFNDELSDKTKKLYLDTYNKYHYPYYDIIKLEKYQAHYNLLLLSSELGYNLSQNIHNTGHRAKL